MPFVTKSSLSRIHTTIKPEEVPDHLLLKTGKIWHRLISQLSRLETKSLLIWKALYINPAGLVEIYQKSDKKDTFTYLDEASASSYHQKADCEYLNSGFITFSIPDYIKYKGVNEVKSFRAWYKQNINRLGGVDDMGNHKPAFHQELLRIFGNPSADELLGMQKIRVKNVDIPVEKTNRNLSELAGEIDQIIDELWLFSKVRNIQYKRP